MFHNHSHNVWFRQSGFVVDFLFIFVQCAFAVNDSPKISAIFSSVSQRGNVKVEDFCAAVLQTKYAFKVECCAYNLCKQKFSLVL